MGSEVDWTQLQLDQNFPRKVLCHRLECPLLEPHRRFGYILSYKWRQNPEGKVAGRSPPWEGALVVYYEGCHCFLDGMVSVVGSEEVKVEEQDPAEAEKAVPGNANGEAFAACL